MSILFVVSASLTKRQSKETCRETHQYTRSLRFRNILRSGDGIRTRPCKDRPRAFTEKLNNDKVRVLEYSSKPGDKEAMHSHNLLVLYVIQGGKLESTAPDGTSKVIEHKTGDVLWRGAITHSSEHVGTTEVRALLVEMKAWKKK